MRKSAAGIISGFQTVKNANQHYAKAVALILWAHDVTGSSAQEFTLPCSVSNNFTMDSFGVVKNIHRFRKIKGLQA